MGKLEGLPAASFMVKGVAASIKTHTTFLVEECQRFLSEEDFWARYSTAGVRLRYQNILDTLKEARESQEKSDAAAARRFFHDNLDHPDADGAFACTKTGQRRIKEKDSVVAEIWRELLANNPKISRRWAEVQRDHRFI
ncbi:hypothetical protein B0H17DRAFT_1138314 [Mycena rosella]|uniref:Uncharacterized protein n=2 Tax=Mycena rosella TaxID=1033263 RepID=A0AAD7GDN5_MYCRO|nr:hypothetical protein B0H17DRAFT_1138314 [Mycena rosella]